MTDERDPKISQRYRQLSGEEPSRELDQSILAAAHRSVDRSHAPLVVPAGRHRWYYGLGAAAVLVLAIAVTLHVERQQPDAELAEAPPPAPAPAPKPQYAKSASESSAPAEQARKPTTARQAQRPTYTPEPPPSAPAPAPAPTPAPSAQPEVGAMADSAGARRDAKAAVREEQANVQALKKERPAVASRNAATPTAAQYAALPPERELDRIAELRKQGRDEEADKALAEFRRRYPDYVIADEMKAKVERK
jgi:hypothetical protein